MLASKQTRPWMMVFRIAAPCCALLTLLVMFPSTARGEEPSLEMAAEQFVSTVNGILEQDPSLATLALGKKIFVGNFVGVGIISTQSSGGTGLAEHIAKKFENLKYQITPAAPLQITGRFRVVFQKEIPTDQHDSAGLEISADILDKNGKALLVVEPFVTFSRAALQVSGPNFDVPTDVGEVTQEKIIMAQLEKPRTIVRKESQVAPAPNSHFAMEVLVKGEARAATLQEETQLPFVEMTKGEEYVVRLHNRADFAVGVRLTIDGVNMFVDAKDIAPDSLVIIQAGQVTEVRGWWIEASGTQAMKAFEVGEAADSVAAREKVPSGKIGTISAAFHAAWPLEGKPPRDERLGAKNSLGTKQGRDLAEANKILTGLTFGVCRSTITIRYDR